jgi:hypothetical protein
MIIRALFAATLALLLGAQVVRNSVVIGYADLEPEVAGRLWSDHPRVEISRAMVGIAAASRRRKAVEPGAFALIDDAARKAPLSPEPFLVHGVQAYLSGHTRLASGSFAQAQKRDPRSMPAAYFLANYYFRSGQPLNGLLQATLLARLSPGTGVAVGPYVAAYAQNPSNWPQIRALFRTDQTIEDHVLTALAQDARNARAILAVADQKHRTPDSPWLRVLLGKMVAAGDYSIARALWASVAHVRLSPSTLLYNGSFRDVEAPPPFGWKLASSNLGIADRQPGSLHVIYYGEEDGVLASQLLLLAPGSYRLNTKLASDGVHSDLLSWSIRCDRSAEPLSSAPAEIAVKRGWKFHIPAGCPAQWLELWGKSGDIPAQAEVTLTSVTLEQERDGR